MKKPDRRVLRTRQTLREALVALIVEKGYENVKVSDITERANVGRSTFYAHFYGKADVLMSGMDGLREHLRAEQQRARAAGGPVYDACLGFSLALFEHAREFSPVFRAVTSGRTSGIMLERLRAMLLELVREGFAGVKTDAGLPPDLVCRFIVDALLSVLSGWLERHAALSAQEADAAFKRLVLPAIVSGFGVASP